MLEVHQLARCYGMLTDDTTRVMSRIKAVFRGQAVACRGRSLYGAKHRDRYLKELGECAQRKRVDYLYQELDTLQKLRRQARHELVVACRKHPASKWLQSVPFLGPLRTAVLLGRIKTPFRFRIKRQFWGYCGLGVETRDSGEYSVTHGQIERRKRQAWSVDSTTTITTTSKTCSKALPPQRAPATEPSRSFTSDFFRRHAA